MTAPRSLPRLRDHARVALLTLAPGADEALFTTAVLDYAESRGWLRYHPKSAGYTRGRPHTTYEGDSGYPDVTLARNGVVIVAELKRVGQWPRPDQRAWATALGACYRLWTPERIEEIVRELE